MSRFVNHPYHLVDESPWPLLSAVAGIGITTGLLKWFNEKSLNILLLSLFILFLIRYQWWRDISREASYQGLHRFIVENGIRLGIILFIVSEVIFFLSFFWAFFHRRLCPNIELGNRWPPLGVIPFNPLAVPFLNTVILLSSGVSVTWAHHAIICGIHNQASYSLVLTIILGAYFTVVQGIEYHEARFSLADSVYGRTFFVATGFHGLHVLVGTLFLIVSYYRLTLGLFSRQHHFGFEASAWYWHFVDVVWLFLYLVVYWWGGA